MTNIEWNDLLYKTRVKKENSKELLDAYLKLTNEVNKELKEFELKKILVSEINYEIRKRYKSSELLGFKVKIGDVCYIDFGKAYINEAGFQHFGVVISMNNAKAFVVPMTSNESTYFQSYCEKEYPCGKKHLMRLPDMDGLNRKSVLFLNDSKFVNTSRVIEIKGHIDVESKLFLSIKNRVKECLDL